MLQIKIFYSTETLFWNVRNVLENIEIDSEILYFIN